MPAQAREPLLLKIVGQQFLDDSGQVAGEVAHVIDEVRVQREVHGALSGVDVEGWLNTDDWRGIRLTADAGSRRSLPDLLR